MAGKVTVGLASYWTCVTDFSGFSISGLNGLPEADKHPAYTPLRSMAPLYLLLVPRGLNANLRTCYTQSLAGFDGVSGADLTAKLCPRCLSLVRFCALMKI